MIDLTKDGSLGYIEIQIFHLFILTNSNDTQSLKKLNMEIAGFCKTVMGFR